MHKLARIQAVIGLCGALIFFYTDCMRLYALLQVWDIVPGVRIRSYVIQEKWMERGYSWRHPDQYFISWKKGDPITVSDATIPVSKERWEKMQVGQKITVYFPTLLPEPYLRNNYTDSWPTIAIIIIIIIGSIGFGIWMIVFLMRARPTPEQPWEDFAYQSSFYQRKKKKR